MKNKGFWGVIIAAVISMAIIGLGTIKTKANQKNSNTENGVVKKETSDSTVEESIIKNHKDTIIYSPMGDSLTEGYFASTSDKRFVEVYAKMLEDNLGYQVDVEGVSGYGGTTENGVKGLDDIVSQQPDLVTIEFGTNDADPNNGSSIDTFAANLDLMIDTLTSQEKIPKIILVTTWNQGEKAEPFDEAIKAIGEKYDLPVADISDIWKDSSKKGPEGVETFKGTSDNFHPNDTGMQKIAEKIYEVSENMME
ncbi:MAG TPA: SGNH/GDSL hydrolase family protein [Candidatus Tetragenococcus pullicola]|nr:SGNH/GDSL hydrolase family protein [Candidatus Tetragenococcus pullicola]